MILKALIIDDEPLAHEVILAYAKEVEFIEIVDQCYSATQAIHKLNDQQVDLVFLDIKMPMITGIELLKLLKKKPQVIITTAYEEYALQGYELDLTDYLLKPFSFERFIQAVTKAFSFHTQKSAERNEIFSSSSTLLQDATSPLKSDASHIFIKVDRKKVQLKLTDISCLEAYGNYVKVFCAGTIFLTPTTLTSFTKLLPNNQFLRVHKSVVINKPYIDYVESGRIHLITGTSYTIGKVYMKNLM
jgi:DNA-binding LytR/AlgR family response regulator